MLCPLRWQERSPAGAWGQAAASHEGTPGQPALGIVGAEPRAGSQPCSQRRSHLPLLASLAPKRSQGLNASWWAASSCSPASFGTPKHPVDFDVCRVLAMQHHRASPGSSMAPERQQAQTRPAWFFLEPFEMSLRSWCPFLFPQGTPGIPPAPGAAPRRCPGTAMPEHRRVPVAPQGPQNSTGTPKHLWDPMAGHPVALGAGPSSSISSPPAHSLSLHACCPRPVLPAGFGTGAEQMLGQPLSTPWPFSDCCFLLLLRAGGSADPSPWLSLSPAPLLGFTSPQTAPRCAPVLPNLS